MAAKITDEAWAEARKRYENESATGYGTIAEGLDCSRNLVVRKAKAEGWTKRISASPNLNRHAPGAQAKFTENAVHKSAQSPNVYTDAQENASPSAAPPNSPAIPNSDPLPALPEKPVFANYAEELVWIETQVAARQRALMERHEKELRALTGSVYDAAHKTGKEGMFEASRSANQLSLALERKQKMELAHEAAQTRVDLGEHYGSPGPRPCVVIVHPRPGVSLFGSNDDQAIEARASAADVRARVIEARRIIAEADTDIARKGGWEVTDV